MAVAGWWADQRQASVAYPRVRDDIGQHRGAPYLEKPLDEALDLLRSTDEPTSDGQESRVARSPSRVPKKTQRHRFKQAFHCHGFVEKRFVRLERSALLEQEVAVCGEK